MIDSFQSTAAGGCDPPGSPGQAVFPAPDSHVPASMSSVSSLCSYSSSAAAAAASAAVDKTGFRERVSFKHGAAGIKFNSPDNSIFRCISSITDLTHIFGPSKVIFGLLFEHRPVV